MVLPGSEDREAAIDALRAPPAPPAMRMELRHLVDPDAAPCVPDQIAIPICRDALDCFGLGEPDERIGDIEGLDENLGEHAAEARQDLGVGGPGRARRRPGRQAAD